MFRRCFFARLSSFLLLSCADPAGSRLVMEDGAPAPAGYVGSYEDVIQDWKGWYTYTYRHIRLSQDFNPLDSRRNRIEKTAFLDSLSSGRHIAMKTGDAAPTYQLFPLKADQSDIRKTVTQMAADARQLMALEGKPLPPLRFTDLNGQVWDGAHTKGKLLLIKCWFINCTACVKEFPDLNRLVEQYKDREDVLFLSLATDERKDLQDFLAKKDFRYAVAPEAEAYMTGKLSVTAYPTHLLVDREGIIRKVTYHIEDLIPSLEQAIQ